MGHNRENLGAKASDTVFESDPFIVICQSVLVPQCFEFLRESTLPATNIYRFEIGRGVSLIILFTSQLISKSRGQFVFFGFDCVFQPFFETWS